MSRERRNGHIAEDTMHSPRTCSSHCMEFTLGHTPPLVDPLTPREEEVLTLLALEGLTNKELAQRLIVVEQTIWTHLSNIYSKIGVQNRTEAAIWARLNLMAAEKNP